MSDSSTEPQIALLRSKLSTGGTVWMGMARTGVERASVELGNETVDLEAPVFEAAMWKGGRWRDDPAEALRDAERERRLIAKKGPESVRLPDKKAKKRR